MFCLGLSLLNIWGERDQLIDAQHRFLAFIVLKLIPLLPAVIEYDVSALTNIK